MDLDVEGQELAEPQRSTTIASEPTPPLRLTETEREVLKLYDRLEEIELEINLYKAQEAGEEDTLVDVTEEELKQAKEELLEAKARYTLRRSIIENVLLANPILKAVHSGAGASTTEQELLPFLQERDNLSINLTATSARLTAALDELTTVEAAHTRIAQSNREEAQRVLTLAKELEQHEQLNRAAGEEGSARAQQIAEIKQQLKTSRQRWRIMKGTLSGIVVGSGVDWAADEELLDLVLEVDSDEEK